MGTYSKGTRLLYWGCSPGKRARTPGRKPVPCEIVSVLEDGRFIVSRDGRKTKVSAKTLDKEYERTIG